MSQTDNELFEGPTLASVRCAFINEAGMTGREADVIRESVFAENAEPGTIRTEDLDARISARQQSLARGEWRLVIPQAYATVRTVGNYGSRVTTFECGLGIMPLPSDADARTKERFLTTAIHDLEHCLSQFGLQFEGFNDHAVSARSVCLREGTEGKHGCDAMDQAEDGYVCVVHYKRSMHQGGDSDAIATNFPDVEIREACKRQLALELQAAADERGVAGDFRVTDVVFEGEQAFPDLAAPVDAVWTPSNTPQANSANAAA